MEVGSSYRKGGRINGNNHTSTSTITRPINNKNIEVLDLILDEKLDMFFHIILLFCLVSGDVVEQRWSGAARNV